MKALLMAAGMGTRMKMDIKGIPKSTVDIGGITLIENTIRELKNHTIEEIGIVVGYKANVFYELFKNNQVTFFYNPFFDCTNSIASLWFAREFIKNDDFLFLNADVFFENKAMDLIISEKKSPVLFVDPRRKEEGDYKFHYRDHKLMNHGKNLPINEISGEYIGIAKVGQDFIPTFKERLDDLIQNQQHDLWWENILYSFLGEREIYVKDIGTNFWGEVDSIDDYKRIIQFLQGGEDK